ncbi:sodium-coupled neutral amino acid transporter 7 isoform X2 [Lepeophtheirus salmonis]|uniref:sodium-coupled neutral amino acid transporter 7 isoform X2 n=1 Tax=Lepeophtheirus salmonis TaxID=72036 RepID=UPI001AE6022B|nr:putative sodium-coupled neutral amino acid transporter 7 isoform X2 [Lepeophtheirus salmonis]
MISDNSPLFAQSEDVIDDGISPENDYSEPPSYDSLNPLGSRSGFETELDSDSVGGGSGVGGERDGSFDSVLDSDFCYGLVNRRPHGNEQLASSRNESGTGIIYTTFLIVNAGLGAALLNFPKSYDEAGGLGIAIFVQAFLLIFILIALLVLAFSADHCGAKTLQDAMYGSAGKFGKYLSSVIVAIYTFGTTITFLIIIGDQIDRVFESWVGPGWSEIWYYNRTFTITMSSVLFILPMCFSKKIDFLSIPSTLGVIAILYIVCLVIYEYYFGDYKHGKIKTHPDSWMDVFLVVPVICFGYQCHVSVIPIYSCMKQRNIKNFTISSFSAIAICCFCYTGAAGWGYYTFGSLVQPDILLMYDASDPKILMANIAMALKTITTYPILLFCGREAIISVIFHSGGGTRLVSSIISLIWFVLSLLSALLIPDIDLVIKALGSLASIFIFVFPGICLFKYTLRVDPSFVRKKTIAILLISIIFQVIGFFIFGVVLTQAVRNIKLTGLTGGQYIEGREYL